MRFRLGDITKPTEMEAPVGALDLELGYNFRARVSPTTLLLAVAPEGRAHLLEGAFEYRAEVPCSRCLRPVTLAGRVEFAQEYRPLEGGREMKGEIEVTPEEDHLVVYEDDALQTDDLVRQQLYLELPEKPLCSESCRGLCPRCGADRNEAPCGCDAEGDGPGR